MKFSRMAVTAFFAAATVACNLPTPVTANGISAEDTAQAQRPPAHVLKEKKLTIRELSVIAGIDCKDADRGLDCSTGNYMVGDYYDVQLSPDCGQNGLFATVKGKKGTELLDKAPPRDTVSLATIFEGQLVCIQATAHIKGYPNWYYVTVVPVENPEDCSRKHSCDRQGTRQVRWHVQHGSTECHSNGPLEFAGACAAGWANASDLIVLPGKSKPLL